MTTTWVAVADLHGHLAHFEVLLDFLDRELGSDYRLCTLGDYVDNGPDIPGLLERLIALSQERGERFAPIVGNHDLALLRTLGWPGDVPDSRWMRNWSGRYWDPGLGTPATYARWLGVEAPTDATNFARVFPEAHRAWLAALPWVVDTGDFLFVHAGMAPGPLRSQVAGLHQRILPAHPDHMPPPLRDKALSRVGDPAWDRVVVSAHNKHLDGPHFEGPQRICLSAEIDATHRLHAVMLPERRYVTVGSDLQVVA